MVSLKQLFMLLILFGFSMFAGCNSIQAVNEYKYYEVGIDDLPPAKDIQAILIMDYYHPELAEIMLAVGNQDKIEEIIGHEIFPEKIMDDPVWLKRLVSNFYSVKQTDRGYLDDARVAFITRKKAYMLKIAADDKVVYGPDYESEELKKDFDELGLD